jgi:hypothetical protein
LDIEVRKWLTDSPVHFLEKTINVVETASGEYSAPALEILSNEDALIAELEPIGAWIIGALGRVDMKGKYETVNLLYLAKGCPHFTIKVNGEEERSAPLFRGVDQDGWYWIESGRLRRARSLNVELFLDLLSEISDYGQ